MPYDEILENGIIKLKNGIYVKILEITPINFNLKSNFEKEAILESYKIFLKTCNFNIQIIIQSQKKDLSVHLNKLINNKEKDNNKIKKYINNYIKEINVLNINNKSDSKKFYILINEAQQTKKEEICIEQLNEKYLKIKDALTRCGNKVFHINSKEEVEEIIKIYFFVQGGKL